MSALRTRLLIVGAGPFGLAMAAEAGRLGVEHRILGRPMQFWRENMPLRMLLRSATDWHLDPSERHTMVRYLAETGRTPADVEPLTLDTYLEYADWFGQQAGIEPDPRFVEALDVDDDTGMFHARLAGGAALEAEYVLLAPGFASFAHAPDELVEMLPDGRWEHTCERVDLDALAGERLVIVGGRQSAFEWAALAREAGAEAVHVVYRHPTPRFEDSDWTWVDPLIERLEHDPGWFRTLAAAEREAIDRRFWEEGRLKLEPWLEPRVVASRITLWPERSIATCRTSDAGELELELDGGEELDADRVILATGYRVDIERVPYLARGNLLRRLETVEGSPVLDRSLQTSIPGLHVTSMPATRDFGSFFAFTVSVRASARIVGRVFRS